MYDQFGTADPQGFGGGAGGPFGNGYYSYTSSGFDGFSDFGDLGDIFSSFFGGGARTGARAQAQRGPRKGADLNLNMDITFEEAFLGVEKEIIITRPETCTVCHGSGARPGTSVTKCPTCNGTGTVRQVQNTILGQMQTTRTCTECHGTGEVIKEPCENCKGKGTVRKQARIKVKIPSGIDDNQTVVLRGEGEPGEKGGPKGDLYITVRVRRSNDLSRQGTTVSCEIPEGTQTGTQFTIRERGFKSINSSVRGSFVFTVVVQTPKRLSKEQRTLLEQLATTMNEQPPVRKRGIFG